MVTETQELFWDWNSCESTQCMDAKEAWVSILATVARHRGFLPGATFFFHLNITRCTTAVPSFIYSEIFSLPPFHLASLWSLPTSHLWHLHGEQLGNNWVHYVSQQYKTIAKNRKEDLCLKFATWVKKLQAFVAGIFLCLCLTLSNFVWVISSAHLNHSAYLAVLGHGELSISPAAQSCYGLRKIVAAALCPVNLIALHRIIEL